MFTPLAKPIRQSTAINAVEYPLLNSLLNFDVCCQCYRHALNAVSIDPTGQPLSALSTSTRHQTLLGVDTRLVRAPAQRTTALSNPRCCGRRLRCPTHPHHRSPSYKVARRDLCTNKKINQRRRQMTHTSFTFVCSWDLCPVTRKLALTYASNGKGTYYYTAATPDPG